MNITYTEKGTFITETCCNCGIAFGMPQGFRSEKLRNGGSFYCPNGHGQHYTETTVRKLERQLASEQSRHDQTKANLRDTKGSLVAEKGHRTRLKKRIKNGICPCCNRSFTNLKRHMNTKHPEYTPPGTKKKSNKHLNILGNLKKDKQCLSAHNADS